MELTKGQAEGLEMIRRIASNDGPIKIGVLAGYAGTGKTTMLKVVCEELGTPIIVAPTGKAALRVREATGATAQTIHRWMYAVRENGETGELSWELKIPDEIETGEAGVLVIEEASMVNSDLWEDVYETCKILQLNIIIVGDPFQLPPVANKPDEEEFNLLAENFMYDERVVLTEVLRQALESPIIRASMMVRNGDSVRAIFELPRIKIGDLVSESGRITSGGGVVICHTNDTRNKLNLAVRQARNLPMEIQKDEPLLVLQNNYQYNRFNGEIVRFDSWEQDKEPKGNHEVKDKYRKQSAFTRFGVASIDSGSHLAVLAEAQVFGMMPDKKIGSSQIAKVARWVMGKDQSLLSCNFGYAMTAHKAQGSEWNEVLVVMEGTVRQNTLDGQRWTYTAMTRAKDRLSLCLGARL